MCRQRARFRGNKIKQKPYPQYCRRRTNYRTEQKRKKLSTSHHIIISHHDRCRKDTCLKSSRRFTAAIYIYILYYICVVCHVVWRLSYSDWLDLKCRYHYTGNHGLPENVQSWVEFDAFGQTTYILYYMYT
uniref:Uncharacterized protein n=1 Tax=Schizaphis graminum TaxID=13262 RepID=A0A2S2NN05_SCHGA